MAQLPFAPPPEDGEGLSSWISRLAAFNFVSTEEFWTWLGFSPDNDVAPRPGFFQHLADVSGVPVRSFGRKFGLLGHKGQFVARALPNGIRGGACPQCGFEALAANRSQFTHKMAASVFRVTCPIHRRRLVSLAGYAVQLRGKNCRFVQDRLSIALGEEGKYPAQPGKLVLRMEDALARAARKRALGPGWRTSDPEVFSACINCLIDVVLWRGLKSSFAASFDDINRGGGTSFFLQADPQLKGHQTLIGQTPATRLHVVSALAALMAEPGNRYSVTTPDDPFRLDTDGAPFSNLAESLRSEQISVLAECLKVWPQCIAQPMISGILETRGVAMH